MLTPKARKKIIDIVSLMETIIGEAAKNCGTGAGGFQLGNDCARGGSSASRVLFEVKPDPTNEKLSGRWNSLSDSEKSDISHIVAKEILPRVFEAAGVHVVLYDQFGGYLDDTSPSFAAVADSGTPVEDVLGMAKLAGFALSQDSMMVLSDSDFDGATKIGLITVDLPKDMGLSATHQIYKSLRSIDNGVIEGHTTVDGQMAIVDFSGDTQGLAKKSNAALGGLYNVHVDEGYVSFPHKEEYDYASDSGGVAGLAERREEARSLRAEVSGLLEAELKKRGKASGGGQEKASGGGQEKGLTVSVTLNKAWVGHVTPIEKGSKVFCPTGPGGGIDPTCSPGGSSGAGKYKDIHSTSERVAEVSKAMKGMADKFKGKPPYSNGMDTMSMYRHKGGTWDAEREAHHEAIISELMKGVTPSDKPVAVLMGGGPAAGKSTAIRAGLVDLPQNRANIAADVIMEALPEYNKMREGKDETAASFAYFEATYIASKVVERAAKGSHSLSLDGTGDSGVDELARKISSMKAGGATLEAHYVSSSIATAIERNDIRSKTPGPDFGRKVPESATSDSHIKVSRVVPEAIKRGLYDKFDLYDTNVSKIPPVLVASAVGKDLTIHDQKLWDDFVAKGREKLSTEKSMGTKADDSYKEDRDSLTVDEMNSIMVDITLEDKLSHVTGPLAEDFAAIFRKELAQARKDGIAFIIPNP